MASPNVAQPETGIPPFTPEFAEETEWRKARATGIGGSEIGSLFPVLNLEDPSEQGSRYGCPRWLTYEKLGIVPDYEHTEEELRLFERGHLMEEFAARDYAVKTGHRVVRTNKSWSSPNYPHMRCYADRLAYPPDGSKITVECKSINEHAATRLEQEGLSMDYALQLQHNMEATQTNLGQFALKIVPDYVDAVIGCVPKRKLRSELLNYLAPTLECIVPPVEKRDDALVQMIGEKVEWAWTNLIEKKRLADPLPNLNDDRCKSCRWRKSCRGTAFAEANKAIPERDKRTGIQYTPIEKPELVQIVADRLQVMKSIDEQEEILKGIDNEIKQNFPREVGAIQIPGTGVKIRWNWQRGAQRWDAEALAADSVTVGRKLAFFDWLAEHAVEHAAYWISRFTAEVKEVPTLADKYKAQSAPSRPFVFDVRGVGK